MVCRTAASASPGSLLEMQNLWPAESESAFQQDPPATGRLFCLRSMGLGSFVSQAVCQVLCRRWLHWVEISSIVQVGKPRPRRGLTCPWTRRSGVVGWEVPHGFLGPDRVFPPDPAASLIPHLVECGIHSGFCPIIRIPSRFPPNTFRLCKQLLQ